MLLDIDDLHLTVPLEAGPRTILRGVSLHVARGETVGLVGESGSGKSTTARAALRLWPDHAQTSGNITVCGRSVTADDPAGTADIRTSKAAMIFQDPRSALNPVRRIGDSATERLVHVHGIGKGEAQTRLLELFAEVGLQDPSTLWRRYPHQLSGGMLQRVVIASALSTGPELLLADEATSALDVTTQAEVLATLQRLQRDRQMGVLFITHDLLLAAAYCDRVYVMKDGVVVDEQPASSIFATPSNAYTKVLAEATPRLPDRRRDQTRAPSDQTDSDTLIASGLSKTYRSWRGNSVVAAKEISFSLPAGCSVGLVGESGSGKTTVARMIVGLTQPDTGTVTINGRDRQRAGRGRKARLARAHEVQMVFQDPYGSLDRRLTVQAALSDVVRRHRSGISKNDTREMVFGLLNRVGLDGGLANSRPHQLSGGQRQRLAIAKALAVEPAVLMLDEAVSALDVSVQAQILKLLNDIRADSGVGLVFVSHDLAVVAEVTDRVLVMYQGEVVEQGLTDDVLLNPQHPYTEMLLSSAPAPGWQPERVSKLRTVFAGDHRTRDGVQS